MAAAELSIDPTLDDLCCWDVDRIAYSDGIERVRKNRQRIVESKVEVQKANDQKMPLILRWSKIGLMVMMGVVCCR